MPFELVEPVGPPCRRCLQVPIKVTVECSVCGYPSVPPNFIVAYEERYRRNAVKAFRADGTRLALSSYLPIGNTARWTPGELDGGARTALRIILGRWIWLVHPPKGALSVAYRRSDLAPEQALARPADEMRWSS